MPLFCHASCSTLGRSLLCLAQLLCSTGGSVAPGQARPAASAAASSQTIEHRVDALLARMTLDEKLGQLSQLFWDKTVKDDRVKAGTVSSYLFLVDPKEINRVQHLAVEQSRLGIPLMLGFDVIHGFHTTFPIPLATASSWDLELNEQVQAYAAHEAATSGIRWAFSPMVDIARDARWGRILEGAGEDPFLGSAMAAARTRGFQGKRDAEGRFAPNRVVACAKHFAGYGAADGGRDYDSVYLSDVQLENTYLPPFKAALDAGAGCIMSGYMDVNDVPASGNRYLLHDVLRDRWHFNGFVVSDAWAVYNLVAHGYAKDHEEAAKLGLNAGVDIDMGSDSYLKYLPELVANKQVPIAEIDEAVRRVLRAKMQLGLFEHPYVDEAAVERLSHDPAGADLARRSEEESAVLLRNQAGALPLSKAVKSVAVIGPLGNAREDILGAWSFAADPARTLPIVDAIREKVPGAAVTFAAGAVIKREEEPLLNRDRTPAADPAGDKLIADAVEAAKASDTVVLVLGEVPKMSGEYASRSSLQLAGRQQELMERVVATGKPVTLVLVAGRPIQINWASTHVPAILQAWFPGQEGGHAIANLLFGDASPSGKLPVSWPRSAGQEPLYYDHNLTQVHEDDYNFAPYYWDTPQSPLYRFGYGLSYTSFRIDQLKLAGKTVGSGGLDVSVAVTNTGSRAGTEVVQLYTHQRSGSASRPVRQLRAFARVALQPGETRAVPLHVSAEDLSYWSPRTRRRSLEAAHYDVWVGSDSAATLHDEFDVSEMP